MSGHGGNQAGGYTLTWKGETTPFPRPADGAFLRPDVLGTLDLAALEAMPIATGNITRRLGEFFDITGEAGGGAFGARLTIRHAPRWSRIGARMGAGELVFEGDVGDELGASMIGGLIRVSGSAGDRVAGPDLGTTRGADGGTIVVQGSVGDHAGMRMRRGLVAIGGTAGASPGFRMLAGTLVVAHGTLDHPLLEARRGTVLSLAQRTVGLDAGSLGKHLARDGAFPVASVVALLLLLKQVESLGLPVAPETLTGHAELWSGDRFELGKGELWQWVS